MSLRYTGPCGPIQQTVTWSLDLIRRIEAGEYGDDVSLALNSNTTLEWAQGEWRSV